MKVSISSINHTQRLYGEPLKEYSLLRLIKIIHSTRSAHVVVGMSHYQQGLTKLTSNFFQLPLTHTWYHDVCDVNHQQVWHESIHTLQPELQQYQHTPEIINHQLSRVQLPTNQNEKKLKDEAGSPLTSTTCFYRSLFVPQPSLSVSQSLSCSNLSIACCLNLHSFV